MTDDWNDFIEERQNIPVFNMTEKAFEKKQTEKPKTEKPKTKVPNILFSSYIDELILVGEKHNRSLQQIPNDLIQFICEQEQCKTTTASQTERKKQTEIYTRLKTLLSQQLKRENQRRLHKTKKNNKRYQQEILVRKFFNLTISHKKTLKNITPKEIHAYMKDRVPKKITELQLEMRQPNFLTIGNDKRHRRICLLAGLQVVQLLNDTHRRTENALNKARQKNLTRQKKPALCKKTVDKISLSQT